MDNKVDWLKPENRFRATPMDLLKQGIVQRQWEAVEFCYLMLTGEKIGGNDGETSTPVKKKRGRPRKTTNVTKDDITDTDDKVLLVSSGGVQEELDLSEQVEEDEEDAIDDQESGEEDSEDHGSESDDDEIVHTSSVIKTRVQKVNVKGRKNRFVDDMTEYADDLKFTPKQIKKSKLPKRPTYKKVRVVCAKCGARETVDPGVVPGKISNHQPRYVCNSCSCGG